MRDKSTKIGVIDQGILAVSKTKEYPALVRQSMGRVLNFALVISILLTIIVYLIPMLAYQWSLGGLETFFQERIPTFTIANGKMEMEGELDMELLGIQIKADSSKEKYTMDDIDSEKIAQVLISNSNLLIKDLGQVFEINFETMKGTINNQTLVGMVPYLYGAEVVLILFGIIALFLRYLLGAFGYALIGMTVASLRQIPLNLQDLFKIGIYCKVLSALVGAVNEVLAYPIPVEYWYSIGMLISFVYLTKGIVAHKTNESSKGMIV